MTDVHSDEANLGAAMLAAAIRDGQAPPDKKPPRLSEAAKDVLRWLRANPGWHSTIAIGKALGRDTSSVGATIAPLVGRGLICRRTATMTTPDRTISELRALPKD